MDSLTKFEIEGLKSAFTGSKNNFDLSNKIENCKYISRTESTVGCYTRLSINFDESELRQVQETCQFPLGANFYCQETSLDGGILVWPINGDFELEIYTFDSGIPFDLMRLNNTTVNWKSG